MAYIASNLSVISYSNGFTLWHYASQDKIDDMLSDDYFLAANDMLRAGDMLLVNSDIADNIACQMLGVASADDQHVAVNLVADST